MLKVPPKDKVQENEGGMNKNKNPSLQTMDFVSSEGSLLTARQE
jgi:hypothetical protein